MIFSSHASAFLAAVALCLAGSHATAGDVAGAPQYSRGGHYRLNAKRKLRTFAPDTPSIAQAQSEALKAEVYEERLPELMRLHVDKLKVEARQSGLAVDTLGQSEARKLKIDYGFDRQGPVDAGRSNSADFDGAVWSRVAPLADILRCLGLFGLPRLPDKALSTGEMWADKRPVSLALLGAPELVMDLASRCRVVGPEACGARTCVRIREELDLLGSEQRAWRAMNVQLDVDGKGSAEHLFDVERGQIVWSRVQWRAKIELRQIFTASPQPLHTVTEMELELDKRF